MCKVLYIKANAKPEGRSRTFRISDNFVEHYKERNPTHEVITLDLYKENIGFLTEESTNLHKLNPEEGRNHPILKYAYQFAEADKHIIAAPLWNLSIPAILRAYIDYICVTGITFKYSSQGPVGLCQGKKAVHIVTRGGEYSEGPFVEHEMGDKYLRAIFNFVGITDFATISADKLDVTGEGADVIVGNAIKKAQEKAKIF